MDGEREQGFAAAEAAFCSRSTTARDENGLALYSRCALCIHKHKRELEKLFFRQLNGVVNETVAGLLR